MSWARVDDDFHDHPKVVELPLDAVGLWTLTLTWAHRHIASTVVPGHLPPGRVTRLAGSKTRRLAKALTDARLWDVDDEHGGWLIHDFEDYLPPKPKRTPEEISAIRSEAGRRGAAARWHTDSTTDADDGKADGKRDSKSDGKLPSERIAKPRQNMAPEPVPVPIGGLGETEPSPGPPLAEPPRRCPEHADNPTPPPCGPCADARKHHEQWEKTRPTGPIPLAELEARGRCEHGEINGRCPLCRLADRQEQPA